jgi:hypothetical protein
VQIARIPSLAKTSSKEREHLASRSRIRNLTPAPSSERLIARLRACRLTRTESGLLVATLTCTARVPISMKNSP